jgi:hypothetical protein
MSAYEYLQVHSHELEPDPIPDETINEESQVYETNSEPSDTLLVRKLMGAILIHSWRY